VHSFGEPLWGFCVRGRSFFPPGLQQGRGLRILSISGGLGPRWLGSGPLQIPCSGACPPSFCRRWGSGSRGFFGLGVFRTSRHFVGKPFPVTPILLLGGRRYFHIAGFFFLGARPIPWTLPPQRLFSFEHPVCCGKNRSTDSHNAPQGSPFDTRVEALFFHVFPCFLPQDPLSGFSPRSSVFPISAPLFPLGRWFRGRRCWLFFFFLPEAPAPETARFAVLSFFPSPAASSRVVLSRKSCGFWDVAFRRIFDRGGKLWENPANDLFSPPLGSPC